MCIWQSEKSHRLNCQTPDSVIVENMTDSKYSVFFHNKEFDLVFGGMNITAQPTVFVYAMFNHMFFCKNFLKNLKYHASTIVADERIHCHAWQKLFCFFTFCFAHDVIIEITYDVHCKDNILCLFSIF